VKRPAATTSADAWTRSRSTATGCLGPNRAASPVRSRDLFSPAVSCILVRARWEYGADELMLEVAVIEPSKTLKNPRLSINSL
jgi:hypothetical protein